MARILLVEDDPALARGLDDNFRDEGYEVRIVSHGDEALPAVAAFRPDLLVLDIMLPGRSGLDILRDLRARGEQMPVLMRLSDVDSIGVLFPPAVTGDGIVFRPCQLGQRTPYTLQQKAAALGAKLELPEGDSGAATMTLPDGTRQNIHAMRRR